MQRARARALGALVSLTLLASPGLTRAAPASFPANPHIAQAQQALDEGEFDKASAELQKALAQPDNADDALVEIYRLQGIVALYKGNRAEARRALEKLFQARPDYELPRGAPPKIRELFGEVQADVRAHRVNPATIDFSPLNSLVAGGPAGIHALVTDPPSGGRTRFYYRRTGSESFSSLELKGHGPDVTGILPASELSAADAPFSIEYYVEVDDAAGRRLAGRGDALTPLTVKVRAPDAGTGEPVRAPAVAEEPQWYERWYVWTAVGVVAAGAGAGTYYLLSRPRTGQLPITVTFQ
jgi:tetratricopeptide (TPR) repeat protein